MIGERLSRAVDTSHLIFSPDGKIFSTRSDAAIKHPLDPGSYIYVKTLQRFEQDDRVKAVEVWHDHARQTYTIELVINPKLNLTTKISEGEVWNDELLNATLKKVLNTLVRAVHEYSE
jgi:hypothetical protein